jgi:CheY-like chemotaxis protein
MSDGQRILVVYDHLACRQNTRQYPLHVGSICAPVGPFKLARCILAVLDQDLSPTASKPGNKSNRGTQTPLTSAKERLSDYGFTPPSRISSKPNESQINDDSVQKIPPASEFQEDGRNQALASFRAMSLQLPSQFAAQTQTDFQPSSSSKPKSPLVSLNSTNGLYILAVDDNELNLQLIHRYLLKRKSDSIIIARNGIEAVAAVREAAQKGENFDIIFMDISMPEMDGFEATRLIRSFERSFAHRPVSEDPGFVNTPPLVEGNPTEDGGEKLEQGGVIKKGRHRAYVVALTGLASRRDRDEAESSGFDNFLTKPISFGKIGDLLKRLSAKKGQDNNGL